MNKKMLIIGVIVIGSVLVSSCNKTKRRIIGTWESTDNKIDGKNEFVASDTYLDPNCGNLSATLKMRADKVTLTIKKDESYTMETRFTGSVNITSDFCGTGSKSIDSFATEQGTWSLVDKTKILFQPKDAKSYECEIVEVTKSKLQLKCPCVEDCSFDILGDNDIDYTVGDWEINAAKK